MTQWNKITRCKSIHVLLSQAFLKRLEAVKPTPGMTRIEQLTDYQRQAGYLGIPTAPFRSTSGIHTHASYCDDSLKDMFLYFYFCIGCGWARALGSPPCCDLIKEEPLLLWLDTETAYSEEEWNKASIIRLSGISAGGLILNKMMFHQPSKKNVYIIGGHVFFLKQSNVKKMLGFFKLGKKKKKHISDSYLQRTRLRPLMHRSPFTVKSSISCIVLKRAI